MFNVMLPLEFSSSSNPSDISLSAANLPPIVFYDRRKMSSLLLGELMPDLPKAGVSDLKKS